MIKLYDWNRTAPNKDEALYRASNYTGFSKYEFKCEVIKEPKKVGLFKKEDGIYHCWYEYRGLNSDKEIGIGEATLYFDTTQKKLLVVRIGYKPQEVDYSNLLDYEIIVKSANRTYTISNKNKALKGALLFGATGAIIGAANSEIVSETVEQVQMIIRLRFGNKEYMDILTSDNFWETDDEEWRNILKQGKEVDEYLKELLEKR